MMAIRTNFKLCIFSVGWLGLNLLDCRPPSSTGVAAFSPPPSFGGLILPGRDLRQTPSSPDRSYILSGMGRPWNPQMTLQRVCQVDVFLECPPVGCYAPDRKTMEGKMKQCMFLEKRRTSEYQERTHTQKDPKTFCC